MLLHLVLPELCAAAAPLAFVSGAALRVTWMWLYLWSYLCNGSMPTGQFLLWGGHSLLQRCGILPTSKGQGQKREKNIFGSVWQPLFYIAAECDPGQMSPDSFLAFSICIVTVKVPSSRATTICTLYSVKKTIPELSEHKKLYQWVNYVCHWMTQEYSISDTVRKEWRLPVLFQADLNPGRLTETSL